MARAAPYLLVWPRSLVLTLVPVGRVGRDLLMPVSWFQARDGEFALQGATKDAIKSMHREHPGPAPFRWTGLSLRSRSSLDVPPRSYPAAQTDGEAVRSSGCGSWVVAR